MTRRSPIGRAPARRAPWRRLAALLSLLPSLAACKTSADLTPEQEYYAGRAFAANVVSGEAKLVDNPVLQEYVDNVGTLLAVSSDRAETHLGPYRSYHFAILDDDAINAFAAPSGFIFLTKGLIKKCENEDELAAILAHEISHVVMKHPEDVAATAKQSSENKKAGAALLGGLGAIVAAGAKQKGNDDLAQAATFVSEHAAEFSDAIDATVGEIARKGFTRDQELAADRGGVELLARVGYDPLALRRTLERLGTRKKGLFGWNGDTHPAPQDRVAAIDAFLAQRQAEKHPLRGTVEDVRTERFKKAVAGLK